MTRTAMRSLFRSLIDETNVAGQIFSDARINQLLYEGAQSVQDLIEDCDEHHFEVEETLTLNAGTVSTAPEGEMRKIKSFMRISPDPMLQLKYLDIRFFDRHVRDYNNADVYGLRGATIVFPIALPNDSVFKLTYTKQIADLEGDDAVWTDLPVYARRLAVYEAALIGLISEGSDVDTFTGLVSDLRGKVIRTTESRGDNSSKGVTFEE